MIAVGYLYRDWLSPEFHHSMMALKDDMSFRSLGLETSNLARGRSEIAAAFMELRDCEHLLFVDTDMKFTSEHVHRLLQAGRPVVSALMMGQHRDQDRGTFYVGGIWKTSGVSLRRLNRMDIMASASTLIPVATVGMGFTLIERSVLEALGPVRPYDPFGPVVLPSGDAGGEDVGFSLKAAEAGFGLYVHPRCRVGHVKRRVI